MSRLLYFDCFSGISGDMALGAMLDAGLPLEDLKRRARQPRRVGLRRQRRARPARRRVVDEVHRARACGAPGTRHRRTAPGHPHAAPAPSSSTSAGDLQADRPVRACRRPAGIARRRCFNGWPKSRPASTRCRWRRSTCTRSARSIRSSTSSASCSRSSGRAPTASSARRSTWAAAWCSRRTGCFPCRRRRPSSCSATHPSMAGPVQKELVTPTGALIVSSYAESFGPVPAMSIEQVGYGAGERDDPTTPNVLRVLIGRAADRPRRPNASPSSSARSTT